MTRPGLQWALLALLPTLAFAQADELAEALELFRARQAERLLVATDPNEALEVLVYPATLERLVAAERYDVLFMRGDEAFEAELRHRAGSGLNQRLHAGERGGADAGSCRGCHFVGGPDGSGSGTQVALLRAAGTLSSATVRDAPHVMGLGYLTALARQIEVSLQQRREALLRDAAVQGQPVEGALSHGGLDFGRITAHPDGSVDTSQVQGVSPDLVLRPFGWKGRHATLEGLADEALQIHHGIQSTSHIAEFAAEPERWLGEGPPRDPDGDGVEAEATEAQAVLLAAYLSLLPVPQIRPPEDPELAFAWAQGRRRFADFGCEACHRPELRLLRPRVDLRARGGAELALALDLAAHAESPRPTRLDFGVDAEGRVPGGVPIFAFTDLRRHDLGEALAEPRPEALPEGGQVPGSVWLTRPLWGLADTGPYLHDGRAMTVDEAIEAHGGEAEPARDAWAGASELARRELRLFLMSLTRAPVVLVE